MVGLAVDDLKLTRLQGLTGLAAGYTVADLEWKFYSMFSGLTPAANYSLSDHKQKYFQGKGISSALSLREAEIAYMQLRGASGTDVDSLEFDYWNRLLGPSHNLLNTNKASIEADPLADFFYFSCSISSDPAWAAVGTHSLKIVPSGANVDTFATPGTDGGTLALGMKPGATYTALGTFRLAGALTGALENVRGRRIIAYQKPASSGYVYDASVQAPNAAGVTDHVVTFTLAPDAVEAFIRFYLGAQDITNAGWWDRLGLYEGIVDTTQWALP